MAELVNTNDTEYYKELCKKVQPFLSDHIKRYLLTIPNVKCLAPQALPCYGIVVIADISGMINFNRGIIYLNIYIS